MTDVVLAFSYLPFDSTVRCTMSASGLRGFAGALEAGPSAARAYLRTHAPCTDWVEGHPTLVDVDFNRRRRYRIRVSRDDVPRLTNALRELVSQPDRSSVSLAGLEVLSQEASDDDLEFYCSSTVPALAAHYVAHMPGSTWEGYVLHAAPTVDALMLARDAFLGWSTPTAQRHELDVFVQGKDGLTEAEPRVAFERLLEPDDSTYQVVVGAEHPLVTPFGSPHTRCQAWFGVAFTQSILSELCVATGDYVVDVRNYLRYRDLMVDWVGLLSPHRLGWGENADDWPEHLYAEPAALDDVQLMWTWFRVNLEPGLSGEPIPAWVRDEFDARFADAKRVGRSAGGH